MLEYQETRSRNVIYYEYYFYCLCILADEYILAPNEYAG